MFLYCSHIERLTRPYFGAVPSVRRSGTPKAEATGSNPVGCAIFQRLSLSALKTVKYSSNIFWRTVTDRIAGRTSAALQTTSMIRPSHEDG